MDYATSTTLSFRATTLYLTSLSLPHLRKGMSVTRDLRESKLLKVKKGLGTVSTVHAVLYVLVRVPVNSHYYTHKKTINIFNDYCQKPQLNMWLREHQRFKCDY